MFSVKLFIIWKVKNYVNVYQQENSSMNYGHTANELCRGLEDQVVLTGCHMLWGSPLSHADGQQCEVFLTRGLFSWNPHHVAPPYERLRPQMLAWTWTEMFEDRTWSQSQFCVNPVPLSSPWALLPVVKSSGDQLGWNHKCTLQALKS